MTDGYYLGLDTSCYTTSVAVVDVEGNIVADQRRLLVVPEGARGLRQSEALFQHIQHLPELMATAFAKNKMRLSGIAASRFPRRQADSYLPVFLAGYNTASAVGTALGIPILDVSHQEGHIRSALYGTTLKASSFLGIHLSGGTTEVLRIERNDTELRVDKLGGTTDLHAGQMVDRVGVGLGLSFPAGPHLEALAKEGTPGQIVLPVSVNGLNTSFSGPLAAAERKMTPETPKADLALAVQECLVTTLERLIRRAMADTGLSEMIIFGGVAANAYLREKLSQRLTGVFFGAPALSGDNAVGAALLAWEKGGCPNGR